jgi:hypothetical protein
MQIRHTNLHFRRQKQDRFNVLRPDFLSGAATTKFPLRHRSTCVFARAQIEPSSALLCLTAAAFILLCTPFCISISGVIYGCRKQNPTTHQENVPPILLWSIIQNIYFLTNHKTYQIFTKWLFNILTYYLSSFA